MADERVAANWSFGEGDSRALALRRAQPMVREHCLRHGVPYVEAGLLESYAFVVRHLNRVGPGDRDPFACPFVVAHRTG